MRIFISPGRAIGKLSSLPFTLKTIIKDSYGPLLSYEITAVPRIEPTRWESQPRLVEQDVISGLTDAKAQAHLVTCPSE